MPANLNRGRRIRTATSRHGSLRKVNDQILAPARFSRGRGVAPLPKAELPLHGTSSGLGREYSAGGPSWKIWARPPFMGNER